jgi:AraC-like DNA-binding protein
MARVLEYSPHGRPMSQSKELAILAQHSGYRVKGMACELGCSCRWLELFCHRRLALTPHAWLARLREEEIRQLARAGVPAKLISHLVGFADSASFCHSLKRPAACTLRQLRGPSQGRCSQKDNNSGSPRLVDTRQSILVRGTYSANGTGTVRGAVKGKGPQPPAQLGPAAAWSGSPECGGAGV